MEKKDIFLKFCNWDRIGEFLIGRKRFDLSFAVSGIPRSLIPQ